jgi:hypothetical protein
LKSKLLQKMSNGVNQSREVVDGQNENESSRPTKGHETLRNPVNPAFDAEARKDFPGLPKRNCRPAWSKTSRSKLQPIHTAANMYSAIPQHLEKSAPADGHATFP